MKKKKKKRQLHKEEKEEEKGDIIIISSIIIIINNNIIIIIIIIIIATLRYKLHFQRANPKPTRPDAKTCWKTILIDAYVVRYGVLKRMDIVQGTN